MNEEILRIIYVGEKRVEMIRYNRVQTKRNPVLKIKGTRVL